MGANNHPTTRVETDDEIILSRRLKSDLDALSAVTMTRRQLFDRTCIVFDTTDGSLPPEVVTVLSQYDASVSSGNSDDPWEAFV